MSDLTINTEDITAALKRNLEGFSADLTATQVGRVLEVGDGIARVSGLPEAAVNEMLEFENGAIGLALNLDEESIGAVLLGSTNGIEEGQPSDRPGHPFCPRRRRCARTRGELPRRAHRRQGPAHRRRHAAWRSRHPGSSGASPSTTPMQTGIKAIDSLIPIGRGQRELIIGDRKTGKTADRHRHDPQPEGLGVKCIYVAIGQKASTVAQIVAELEATAPWTTRVVVAPGVGPGAVQVHRPVRRCAMGEHWMDNGEHALVVYDDLSKQAEAYRQMSLLLRRPPGVRPTPATSSTCTAACSSAPPSSPTTRRRVPHRPADHRDQGGRRLGLHPDQRHLDHRRPDLPRGRPVQVGCASRHRRRHLGVPRRSAPHRSRP